ncbi:26S proteasome non-ATPase regulatory subunit 3-like protein [Piptocephalis cylindrospora]|uniref:26S proteasome regulatory subunit RPN3 n=1 Tax=Piptocephalis cylindrospora TaxID=1907219 RepID=A0A4P9Y562_9FUNG|nr:26S proteasome non-ATPase regulatory subunit 3-like protein [Piptocephalis cylindrospora]|eukprot:RKP13842.1 26S proteasome non-ATPase regulatory subunit 3-like protein [Piptocephalis cylindrospora]
MVDKSSLRSSNKGQQAPPSKDQDIVLEDATPSTAQNNISDKEAYALILTDIQQHLSLLDKAVSTFEGRFTSRVLRTLPSLRRRLTGPFLSRAISTLLPSSNAARKHLIGYLDPPSGSSSSSSSSTSVPLHPESEIYLTLLVLILLIDQRKYDQAKELSEKTIQKVHTYNRRTLDPLSARIYFYYVRAYELSGQFDRVLPTLMEAQRFSALRRDTESQATLINLLLRFYFHFGLHEQADKFIAHTPFPEGAGNNQAARYNYYLGRVRALQLEYSEAHAHLLQASRKAPQTEVASGFLQAVQKVLVVVELLMGEIPERSLFRQRPYTHALAPYLAITQAVRTGDLDQFQQALSKHQASFKPDQTYTLILRLRINVIKTGIRMISLSYSRISLKDICLKLHLDSEADAESIVAKAIRDGVIEARIDHERGFLHAREASDIYVTREPQLAFDQRISYCLNLHNQSVRAMRYPQDAHKKELAMVEDARERERETVAMIEESGDMDEEEDDMGDY